MADLGSTRVFGRISVSHEAFFKDDVSVDGVLSADAFVGDGSGLRAQATTKADVGLSNVPNWSGSTSTSLGTSNTAMPSQGAVKAYVDSGLSGKANSTHTHPVNQITGLGTAAARDVGYFALKAGTATQNFTTKEVGIVAANIRATTGSDGVKLEYNHTTKYLGFNFY